MNTINIHLSVQDNSKTSFESVFYTHWISFMLLMSRRVGGGPSSSLLSSMVDVSFSNGSDAGSAEDENVSTYDQR